MDLFDAVQDWFVELGGLVIFAVGVFWYIGESVVMGVGAIVLGLILMGYKKLPRRIRSLFGGIRSLYGNK